MRCRWLAVLLLPGLLMGGCATRGAAPASSCTPTGAMVQAELLFGLSMPGGGVVSAAAFDAFVADTLSPAFPAGLTVLPGAGLWRAPDGTMVREGARMVLVAAPDTAATNAALNAVRRAYRLRFDQRAVGLITVQACATFGG